MADTANESAKPSMISHAPIDTMERNGLSNRYHISKGFPRSQNSISAANAKSPKAPSMPHRAQSGTRRTSQPGFAQTSIAVAHRNAPPAVPARNKYQIAKSLNTRTPSLTTPQYTQPTAQQAKPGGSEVAAHISGHLGDVALTVRNRGNRYLASSQGCEVRCQPPQ